MKGGQKMKIISRIFLLFFLLMFALISLASQVQAQVDLEHFFGFGSGGKKLYVTHSGGTADKVTVYRASKRRPVPVHKKDLTVGLNPFGIAYVP